MKLSILILSICRNNMKIRLRSFIGIALLTLVTATATYSQAIYSDVWIDDSNSDTEGNGAFVVGRGVSEINYVDEDGIEVETRITSPNGQTVMNGAFGEVSAEANRALAFNWDDFIGNFDVRTERFPMCVNGYSNNGDEGIMIRHWVNSTGGLWYRPAGYRRCPRNPLVNLASFPLGITYIAMILKRPADFDGYGFLYEKVVPCNVYCNAPITNRYPGPETACIQLQIAFGPFSCSRLVRVVRNVQGCICFDTGFN